MTDGGGPSRRPTAPSACGGGTVRAPAVLLIIAAISAWTATAHDDQRYDLQELVPLFVDNVIPEHNPSESYRYYSLPFCPPPSPMKHKSQSLGEVLQGSRKIYSNYEIRFGVDVPHEVLCEKVLHRDEVEAFRRAILQRYHFTMYYDDIPLRHYVGVVDPDGATVHLHTTLLFKISLNRDRVIDAHVSPDSASKVALRAGDADVKVTFAYEVKWHEVEVTFEDRAANNAPDIWGEEVDIQWFSIINSFAMLTLLVGILLYILLHVLRKDMQRYVSLTDEDEQEEGGWKRLHADVFRFPANKSLLCAILGCGSQLMTIVFCLLTLAVVGVFYPYGRGTTYAAAIVIYALTAIVAGHVSGSVYRSMGGTVWVHNVLLTVTLFVFPVFCVWAFLNTVALVYDSTAALPFGTIVGLFALYFIVAFPLTLAGAIMGKNTAGDFNAPTQTKIAPREIPRIPWYRGDAAQVCIAGLLPFSSIYVELFYVFTSLWGHQTYTPFGLLYLVFILLLVVTAIVTVSLTYMQLSFENHYWWWLSVLSGGSTALYIAAYSFVFFFSEHMSGFLQMAFYFGYTAVLCYAVFLMLGTVGYYASLTFVRQIYKSIKSD